MKTCQQCRTEMPDDAPEGLCPRCLISAAVKPGDLSSEPTRIEPESGAAAAQVASAFKPQTPDIPDIGDAAEVARRLPQFEILSLLGRGGMGVVYKARQLNLDRIVALKILPPGDAMSPDFVERFRREARSLAKLSHPNIVAVHDFGESGGLYYFAMEFVDGVNLRDMIRTGKMKPEEALAVVPKICDALQFAHEEGVVHRDVKPENILIDKRGRVKIADFGLAKLLRREQSDHTLTMTGMTLGTPRYMAPEQLDKPETVDHRADIYSLGVVFYEMLTGEVPMGRFAPPSEKVRIDVRLDEIVLHALERDADRRYQHVSQVRDDVEKVTSKPQVEQASPPQSSRKPAAGAPQPLSPPPVPQELRYKIGTAGIVMLIAGIALLLGGFVSFAVGASWDVWHHDKYAALGLAGAGTLHFLAGIAAISASIFMRRMCCIGFSFAAAWMLCVLPFTAFLTEITLLKFAAVPLAFALYAGIRSVSLLFQPETKAAFAAVRAQSSDEADASRSRALSLAVGVTGGIAACLALFWGFSATGMGPGLPWRFDILVWLPGAVAAFGAAVLLIQSSNSGRAAAADAIPEMTLAALGMGVGALPWRGLDHAMPNPWSNLVGSAWESGQGALFSLTYLVLGLFLLVTGGRKARPAWRAAVTLLVGVTAFVLALHFATHPAQPPLDGFWHMPNGTLVTTLTFQLCFLGSFAIALLTVGVGAMQLRNRASESDASAAASAPVSESSSEPRLSRLALWGAIWAGFGLPAAIILPLAIYSVRGGALGAILHIPVPLFAFFAITAPIGVTFLGAIAIAQIKRSGGKLYGLRLAAADAIFFPLLLVGAVAFYITNLIAAGIAFNLRPQVPGDAEGVSVISFAVLDALIVLVVCFFVGRKAWRAIVGQSAAPTNESKPAVENNEPRLSRLALLGTIWAPFTAMGWWSWQMCVRQYFDNPAQFATYDPFFRTLGVGTFIVAATAGLGSTLLGGIAVAQIKRSGRKLYGLPLAAIALLIHPLAALGSGAFLLLRMAYSAATRNWLWIPSTQEYPPTYAYSHFIEAFNVVGILAALLVCFFAGRAAWRKIAGQPAAPR